MVNLSRVDKGFIIYDFEKAKSLELIYGGTTDLYFRAEIFQGGELEKDKSLMFVIDKENIELYNVISKFFNSIKTYILKNKSGKKENKFPSYPFLWEIECQNHSYDVEELYEEDNNQIKWKSEAGNSFFNINADTIMFIQEYDNKFRFIFKNDRIVEINPRFPRNVCVCNSGSCSKVFPALCYALKEELGNLEINIENEDAMVKILKKSN